MQDIKDAFGWWDAWEWDGASLSLVLFGSRTGGWNGSLRGIFFKIIGRALSKNMTEHARPKWAPLTPSSSGACGHQGRWSGGMDTSRRKKHMSIWLMGPTFNGVSWSSISSIPSFQPNTKIEPLHPSNQTLEWNHPVLDQEQNHSILPRSLTKHTLSHLSIFCFSLPTNIYLRQISCYPFEKIKLCQLKLFFHLRSFRTQNVQYKIRTC